MDHSELVAELPRIEKLTAADRLKIARERRILQLRVHEQYEREYTAKRDKMLANQRRRNGGKNRGVRFILSVMLLEAAARNDIEEVRRLLMQGGNPDSTNEDGLTALHQCCIDDSESMMKLLLEFGANVNAEDSEKWTPLHAAATCGHLHLVKYLISKGANLLAVNADGNMPYDICEDEPTLDYIESEMARRGVTQELIDQTRATTERQMLADLKEMAARGESLEFEDAVGARPLHIAAANGYLSVVEFLLDQHVATDSKDHDGWQPIHAASCWGHLEVVELLVQNGSDLNAQTKNHETPFDICEDPEMKSRIAALRNEQENRARADHQKNRRSQSSSANTRTHSIRRNSTRDKGQISKKQIKNEAIFGIQNDDNVARDSHEKLPNDPSWEVNSSVHADPSGREVANSSRIQTSRDGREGALPPPPTKQQPSAPSSATSCESTQPHFISSPYLTASALNDNTIDIRVSVTINALNPNGSRMAPAPPPPQPMPPPLNAPSPASPPPVAHSLMPPFLPNVLHSVPSLSGGSCTLADLKRQRSQYRIVGQDGSRKQNPILNSFIFPALEMPSQSVTIGPDAGRTNGHTSSDTVGPAVIIKDNNQFAPDAARKDGISGQLPKFQGETTELVGTKKSESSCCVLS